MHPYNFSCDFFNIYNLSANGYQVIEEEMFITPVCYDSRERLGIFGVLFFLFLLFGIIGLGFLVTTSFWQRNLSKNFLIKVLVTSHPFFRAASYVISVFASQNLSRYFFYALPISVSFAAFTLILLQWFQLTLRLSPFDSVISSANLIIKKLRISLLLVNILFNIGVYSFWIAAGVVRNYGYSYQLHNILMGTGFAWQGAISMYFSAIIFWAGYQLVSILKRGNLHNHEIDKIIAKVNFFSRFSAFMGTNVAFGSFVATVWMAATLTLPHGMIGFRYMVVFFSLAEFFVDIGYWFMLLRSSDFKSGSSQNGSSKTEPESSLSKNFTLKDSKAVDSFIVEYKERN